MALTVAEHTAALRADGELLARAAAAAGPDRAVPTCPEWCVRDLVRHTGGVHRWATGYVTGERVEASDVGLDEVVGSWPDDEHLVEWFRTGVEGLAASLEGADPDLECFTFLPAPSPLAFWARRQAHETAMHRVDAQSASPPLTPFAPVFAADGIDEMLFGFARRPGKLESERRRVLRLDAPDADRRWFVTLGPDGGGTSLDPPEGVDRPDCAIRADAADLYLLLWNRRPADGFTIDGDRAVIDEWRDRVRVRWS